MAMIKYFFFSFVTISSRSHGAYSARVVRTRNGFPVRAARGGVAAVRVDPGAVAVAPLGGLEKVLAARLAVIHGKLVVGRALNGIWTK